MALDQQIVRYALYAAIIFAVLFIVALLFFVLQKYRRTPTEVVSAKVEPMQSPHFKAYEKILVDHSQADTIRLETIFDRAKGIEPRTSATPRELNDDTLPPAGYVSLSWDIVNDTIPQGNATSSDTFSDSLSKISIDVNAPKSFAIFDYEPTQIDELQLKKGDAILVAKIFKDTWAYGYNLRTDREGVFPSMYVEMPETVKRPPTLDKKAGLVIVEGTLARRESSKIARSFAQQGGSLFRIPQ